ncbi:MAG: 3-dehydroquinate synthase [Planctomycetota bacterium]
MIEVTVTTESAEYPVLIGSGCLGRLGTTLCDRGLDADIIAVFTSPRIGDLHYEALQTSLTGVCDSHIIRHDIPDGEENKNFENYRAAVNWLAKNTSSRQTTPLVINFGGGVVGDLGGFVAATFRRGVPFVHVPTTLLGVVDTAIGGKLAINTEQAKNLVGSVTQPRMVFSDIELLRTLPKRQVRSGAAEVIKYGAALDADFFEYLEEHLENLLDLRRDATLHVARRCTELKARVIRRDEYDNRGIRICLNYGHTLGHAVERHMEGELTHGECVAIGMVAAGRISARLDLCDQEDADRLEALIERAGLPTRVPQSELDPETVLETMKYDKKFVEGVNRFVLMTGIGEWTEYTDVPMEHIRAVTREALAPAAS